MQSVIKVSQLTKQFKNLTAVSDLSFSVNQGDVYGFLGQNGAGKSTTIRMLLTLIAPTSGEIELFGMNIKTHRSEILRQVGAVVEKPDVYKYLSAYENVSLFAKLSGIKATEKLVMDQLEMVGLASRAKDTVKTFSQGMKQRLGIAIALVHNPQLIVLDEPTNGLDPQGIADIRNLILHLSKEMGKTIVVSSHLLSEIEQVASRLLIIDKGKKLVEGNAHELFDPAQTIVEIETVNNAFALAQLQQSSWQSCLQPQRGSNLLLKLHKEDLPAFHKSLVEMGVGVISFQPRHSLEDYFLQITSNNQHVPAFTN
ncbi:ABC transporter ATP-binding protein [Parasediminibacterium sp. JCM 36343]|uniref:ABC transporter ATP-binding protein n=1 Tax=Parasediminibacterium sp. JCM 36343 TaxID=3374279 RepID=UPI0039784B91